MRRGHLGCSVLLVVLMQAAPALPQEGPEACQAEPEVCGKRAFEAGIEAFQRGDHLAALKLFREAQSIKPHPVILFNVALAESKTGLLLEAVQHFEEVFDDPATPAEKLDAARSERDRVAALLARVSVDRRDAKLYVDGELAGGTPPSMRTNPGQHQVKVVVGDDVAVDRTVTLKQGERLELSLAPPPRPKPEPKPKPKPAPTPAPVPQADTTTGLSPTWVYMGAALTAVLGGFTVYSGLDASAAYDDFERDAPNLTEEQARERVDEGEGKDLRTNLLLGATAVVGLATAGAAVFAVDWTTKESGGAGAALAVAPGQVVLCGRF